MARETKRQGRTDFSVQQTMASPATLGYGDKTKVTQLGRVWDGGGGSDGAANAQVGQYYGYAQRAGKQTQNAWYDYWRAGSDVYGKLTERVLEQKSAPKMGRMTLLIDKDKSLSEGKNDLVEDINKPIEITAEDVLNARLLKLKRKGRVAMPSSGGSKDEPTINVSSEGAIGLNFS